MSPRSMDPGFRLLQSMMAARDHHRALGRLLPDWPQAIKDEHDKLGRALGIAWRAMWDVYAPDDDATLDMTAQVLGVLADEARASTRLDGDTHCVDAADVTAATTEDIIEDALRHDEPPSTPA
jgi:hypothetical protein